MTNKSIAQTQTPPYVTSVEIIPWNEAAREEVRSEINASHEVFVDGRLPLPRELAEKIWFPPDIQNKPNTLTQRISSVPTQELIQKFLTSRRGTVADESLTSYRHTLSAFAKHCPVLPTTPEELESYFARFTERRSAASAYSPIKQLYEFGNARYSLPNAMKSVKRARFKSKEPYSFTLDEARAVVNACRNDRELGLIHLCSGHGFRLDEACRVNVGDILDGQINVRNFIEEPAEKGYVNLSYGFAQMGKVQKEHVALIREAIIAFESQIRRWQEYGNLQKLYTEFQRLKSKLQDELAVIIYRRIVSGRCKYCPI